MFSGYIKAPSYPLEILKNDINFTTHCLSIDSEKHMTIDEVLLR
jgi:hypothetical protein